MKTAKRLFACALLCTILGSAAACGDTPSESSANTPDNNTAAVTDAVTEAAQEGYNIRCVSTLMAWVTLIASFEVSIQSPPSGRNV